MRELHIIPTSQDKGNSKEGTLVSSLEVPLVLPRLMKSVEIISQGLMKALPKP